MHFILVAYSSVESTVVSQLAVTAETVSYPEWKNLMVGEVLDSWTLHSASKGLFDARVTNNYHKLRDSAYSHT